jgi:hypothetical protein
MMCRLCDNEASYVGWDRDPEDPKASRIYVCGLHSLDIDDRRVRVEGDS